MPVARSAAAARPRRDDRSCAERARRRGAGARSRRRRPRTASARFRETFGETPHRYLQRRRLAGDVLLRETDRTVTEICFDVGFSSLGPFSRTFLGGRRVAEPTASARAVGSGVRRLVDVACDRPRSSEKSGAPAAIRVRPMLTALTHSQHLRPRPGRGARLLRRQLGLEVRTDAELAFCAGSRSASPAARAASILLESPGPPAIDVEPPSRSATLVAKGAIGDGRSSPPSTAARPTRTLRRARRRVHQEPTERSTVPTARCATRSATRSGSRRRPVRDMSTTLPAVARRLERRVGGGRVGEREAS